MKITWLAFRDPIFHDSRGSIDAVHNKAEFNVVAGGVLVKRNDAPPKGDHPIKFVPWSNIKDCNVELEASDPQFAAAAKKK